MEPAVKDIVDQVRNAQASGQALHVRGGGSKAFLHTGEALAGASVLSTQALQGIVSYEPSELVVTVRAGTPLAELESVLAERGQALAFEPPHPRWSQPDDVATVGGALATGLSGPARPAAGSARDHVLGLGLVNGRGEHLQFGGRVMKNVAGYDVSRLMVGAMGTLGVITEVSLKVLPVAPARATLRFELDEARALAQLQRWLGQPLPLNASNWVDDGGRPALYVRLCGALAAVEAACRTMLSDQSGTRLDSAQVDPDWALCRDGRLPFFQAPGAQPDAVLWRLSVPPATPPLPLPQPQLIDWHGGLRWLWAPAASAAELHRSAKAAGGQAMAYWAPPGVTLSSAERYPVLSPVLAAVHERVKLAFDPARCLNPGHETWLNPPAAGAL